MQKTFKVDGFVFTKEPDKSLKIEFKVGGIVHIFKIQSGIAEEMAKILQEFYEN